MSKLCKSALLAAAFIALLGLWAYSTHKPVGMLPRFGSAPVKEVSE